jgi:hypothetical protein
MDQSMSHSIDILLSLGKVKLHFSSKCIYLLDVELFWIDKDFKKTELIET